MKIIGRSGGHVIVTMTEDEIQQVSGKSTYRDNVFKEAVKEGKPYEFAPLETLSRVMEVTQVPHELKKLKKQMALVVESIDKAIDSAKQNDFLAFGKSKEEAI